MDLADKACEAQTSGQTFRADLIFCTAYGTKRPFNFRLSGSEQEELHYRYALPVLHGKSEYTDKGPVISMVKSCQDIKNEGRCLVIRKKVWDYMSYKLKITKH